jgi:recombination protein RecA
MKEFGKWFGDIEKRLGKGTLIRFNEDDKNIEIIPTGIYSLDTALGNGGLPKGRIVEIYGQEATGKSTLCLHLAAECQKQGGTVLYLDMEHALHPRYAEKLGVNLDDMVVSQPTCAEDCLEIAENAIRSGEVSLVIIDSVAALVPQAELNGEMGDSLPGLQARLMGQALRKITPIASSTNTMVVFVNQLREKIGVMFGSPETTPGGKALKFYTTVRLDMRAVGKLKTGEEVVGNRVKVKVIKNKLSNPFKESTFDLVFGKGVSKENDLIDAAIEQEVIKQAGAWFYIGEEKIQGKDSLRKKLEEDNELYNTVIKSLQ